MRIKLIPDWHKAYKFGSVQVIAFAAAVKLVLLGWPDLATMLPQWVTQTVAIFALLGLVLAARVTTTEKSNDPAECPRN